MKMMLSLNIMMISILMLFIYHPLSMVISILFQTLFICLLLGMMNNSYWFSYILFLIFLGGLLILFVYVSSIASNELFQYKFNYKYLLFMSMIIIMIMTSFLFKNNLTWLNISFNQEMNTLFNLTLFFNNENLINLTKLYNNQNFLLMMMMVIYLFITLIAIVKITNIFLGPLRSFN